MEDKKANIIATISILALIIVIITARVTLKLSKTFYLIAGVDISPDPRRDLFPRNPPPLQQREKILVSKYVSEGRELRSSTASSGKSPESRPSSSSRISRKPPTGSGSRSGKAGRAPSSKESSKTEAKSP
uniref:Uncharacterized protein n=1 Tax=Brassica oleracea TaxID=3712 RepID=A0A3P6D217_BRAOL|nr:unnamed protein product [Brassica oleracea]